VMTRSFPMARPIVRPSGFRAKRRGPPGKSLLSRWGPRGVGRGAAGVDDGGAVGLFRRKPSRMSSKPRMSRGIKQRNIAKDPWLDMNVSTFSMGEEVAVGGGVGVGVWVAVGVWVDVEVGVSVGGGVGVDVDVSVAVGVGVSVGVGVAVGAGVGVRVGVEVCVGSSVGVDVWVSVLVSA